MNKESKKPPKYYYCISVMENISVEKEIFIMADRIEVINGDLILYRQTEKEEYIHFSIAKQYWQYIFSASQIDGSPVFVEHWKKKD